MRRPQKRTLGDAIDRAVREAVGPRAGHHYLRQHWADPTLAAAAYGPRRAAVSDSEPLAQSLAAAGAEAWDLSGVWVWEASAWGSPTDKWW